MDVVISGTITAILPEQSGVSQRTGNAWLRAQYKLEHEHGQYPKSVVFDVIGEEKKKQFNIQQGEEITCHLNLDSHEFNGRHYNSIECWKVERAGQQQTQQPTQAAPTPQAAPPVAAPAPQTQQPAAGQAPMPPQGQAQGGQQNLPF